MNAHLVTHLGLEGLRWFNSYAWLFMLLAQALLLPHVASHPSGWATSQHVISDFQKSEGECNAFF